MKTLVLYLLLLAGSGLNKTNHRLNKNDTPISILKIDVLASVVDWHINKITGKHDGTIKVSAGQLSMQNHRLKTGMVLLDMNTLAVTDLTQPDKGKLETNLKGSYFFDAGRFAVTRFDITNVAYASNDSNTITITGNLNMHGIAKSMVFKAAILKADQPEFIARADLTINRRDWNIATGNFKYDHFISPVITLHIVLKASGSF